MPTALGLAGMSGLAGKVSLPTMLRGGSLSCHIYTAGEGPHLSAGQAEDSDASSGPILTLKGLLTSV